MLTFKKFLSIVSEDANLDKMVMDIQVAISNIDNQINQRIQPLNAQKQNLQKRLAPLLKKKEQSDALANKEKATTDQQMNQQQAPGSNTTTTPGSTGTATPGGGASTIQGR